MKNIRSIISIFIIAVTYQLECNAEIYKYKDENGNWQFSDKPPPSKSSKHEIINTEDPNLVKSSNSSNNSDNLASKTDLLEQLKSSFSTETPIEKTTLSVVSIKTAMGGGTGFFVSNDGYIITNRHVVRPTSTKQWEKSKKQFKESEKRIVAHKKLIDRRKKDLKRMSIQLERYRKRVESESNDIKSVAHSDYRIYRNRYRDLKKELEKNIRFYKDNKAELRKKEKDFNFSSAISQNTRRFEILLKDNTSLKADLVSISKDSDLALLKLKGYKTPYINLKDAKRPSQGSKAYAIGSPLGLSDYVTSGIITNVSQDKIVTDTQILPGNSGGPLISAKGEVLGINTQKLLSDKSIGSTGFGIAIPISYVTKEFKQYINN